MGARMKPQVGILVLATLFLSGCAAFEDAVPRAFEERQPLPSCGEIELAQGERIPESAVACMDAAGDTGAELIVSAPTVEGDLVVTYYRSLPGGGVEIYTDSTLDKFAGGGSPWTMLRCPDAQSILAPDLGECTSEEL